MVKRHCHHYKHSDGSKEGYVSDRVSIEKLASYTSTYSVEIITDACNELFVKKFIEYNPRDLFIPRHSVLYLKESGREAYKYAEYPKIVYKKWGKRGLIFISTILALLGIWKYFEPKTDNDKSKLPRTIITSDTIRRIK